MPNYNYCKGRRKEYKLVKQAKAEGKLAFRSAGSHSPVDVVIIDSVNRIIELVQCKPDNYPESKAIRLFEENYELNGTFKVCFKLH